MLHRVTLEFPTDAQVRYLERLPEKGEHIRGLAGEEFVVSHVEPDGAGFVVFCALTDERAIPMTTSQDTQAVRASPNRSDSRLRPGRP
jgi:hypothetical protein